MMRLPQKERRFEWKQDQKRAFDRLKEAFTTASILARFDFERDAVVEANTSN